VSLHKEKIMLQAYVLRARTFTRIASLARPFGCVFLAALVAFAMPSYAQTPVTIGTAKDPNLAAEIVIARDKGFFKAEGLDATVAYFPSGGDLMAAVVGGSISIGSSGSTPLLTLRARPYAIRIIAQMSDISDAVQIVVKKSVKSIDDLYGKKFAIMPGTGSEAIFNSFARAYGFDASKVTLVNMAPAEMLSSFSRGDVEGLALWEPHTTRARKLFDGKILVTGTKSAIPGNESGKRIYADHSMLFATESFIRDKPEVVKSVLKALARAGDFIGSNRDEATQILGKEFAFDKSDMTDIMASNRYTLELDDQLVKDVNGLADFLHQKKSIQSMPDVRAFIDPEPLRSVRPDLVKLK
jgi:ABC-type nitrate/sulfonate/bicarbonate transport system substrate-binding protein